MLKRILEVIHIPADADYPGSEERTQVGYIWVDVDDDYDEDPMNRKIDFGPHY